MSRHALFDQSRLQLRDLDERGHNLRANDILPLQAPARPCSCPRLKELTGVVLAARRSGHPVLLLLGGHPVKLGLSRFLVDLLDYGLITHLATNGAGLIHDYELARVGGTSEDVARWLPAGQFGLWQQTSELN